MKKTSSHRLFRLITAGFLSFYLVAVQHASAANGTWNGASTAANGIFLCIKPQPTDKHKPNPEFNNSDE